MVSVDEFMMNVTKRIRQEARVKMQQKMDSAASRTMAKADDARSFDDVTGNLYKSIGIGTYYNGALQSVHRAPGPEPTRPTLAKGETYDLPRYYRSSWDIKWMRKRPFKGKVGEGGQNGPDTIEDTLLYNEHGKGRGDSTWQMSLIAGVDYAQFVQTVRKHDVISKLRDYLTRYFKNM